jgi:hypothetical protein
MRDMERDASITFRIASATRKALEEAAEAERRSLSNLVAAILAGWLETEGYLPKVRPAKRRKGS